MSLINDMLRDLDARRAKLPAPPRAVLSVPPSRPRRWPPAWPLVFALLIAALVVAAAVLWQSASWRSAPTESPTRTAASPESVTAPVTTESPAPPNPVADVPSPAAPAEAAKPDSAESTFLWVTGSRVNLRAAPTASAAVLATLTRGTRVNAAGTQADYVQVQTAEGLKGWIRADLLGLQSPDSVRAADAPTVKASPVMTDLPPPPLPLPQQAPATRPSPGKETVDPASLHRRAMEQIRAGDLVAAEQTLRTLLDGTPGHGPAMQSLAGLLIQSGRRGQLVELIGRWEADGKAPANLRLLRARLRIEQGEAAAAVLGSQPLDPASLSTNDALTLANLQQRAGDHAAAVMTARQVISREPGLGSAWATLALSLDQQSQTEAARDAWRKALQAGGLAPAVVEHARSRLEGVQP